ncbi:ABC transporter permease subunit [Singulisphaera sp. PoT]|uniref:ABC transporter permease subunit n=1 Tax=Singulisphaera sp. PoT TaxID=3411797 RepID=UPI003BF52D11
MFDNPIFRHELRRVARGRAHYIIRVALGLMLLLIAWNVQALWISGRWTNTRGLSLHQLRRLPGVVFMQLIWAQGVLLAAVLPAWVAGAIAEEDRRGNMLEVLTTPISSRSIILGKLGARLVRVLIVIGSGLPMVLPMTLLGLLDLAVVVRAYLLLVVLAGFVTSLALLISTLVARPREATLLTYLLMGAWLLLPKWLEPTLLGLPKALSWLTKLDEALLLSNPASAGWGLFLVVVSQLYDSPANVSWAWAGLAKSFPTVIAILSIATALFVALSVACLRPIRLGLGRRGRVKPLDEGRSPAHARRPIEDDPMRWKERYASSRYSKPVAWVTCILLGIVMAASLLNPALEALTEQWSSLREVHAVVSEWRREQLNEMLRSMTALLYLVGLVGVMTSAASRISGERERGTWVSLGTTPLTGLEIARAKVFGTVREMRGLALFLVPLWLLGLVAGAIHPLGIVAATLGLVVFFWYASAVGVLCSMATRSTERAMLSTFLILSFTNLFGLFFVPLELIGRLAGSSTAIYVAGVTPFVEWFSLASPLDIRVAMSGIPWEKRMQLPFELWSINIYIDKGLVQTFLASLALHALGAFAATRLAALVYDAGRGEPLSIRGFIETLGPSRRLRQKRAEAPALPRAAAESA